MAAGPGEVAPGTRVMHRNGHRRRAWEDQSRGKRVVLIRRSGSGPAKFPSFLEARGRSEQVIVGDVLQVDVNGV